MIGWTVYGTAGGSSSAASSRGVKVIEGLFLGSKEELSYRDFATSSVLKGLARRFADPSSSDGLTSDL